MAVDKTNCLEITKIALGLIGAMAGICACVVFAYKYHNIHGSVWAAISALMALVLFYMILSVRQDVKLSIPTGHFVFFMIFGGFGIVTGLSVFVTYLIIGAKRNEDLNGYGSYVVVVWGYMTFKWSLITLLSARSYNKRYCLARTLILNSD